MGRTKSKMNLDEQASMINGSEEDLKNAYKF